MQPSASTLIESRNRLYGCGAAFVAIVFSLQYTQSCFAQCSGPPPFKWVGSNGAEVGSEGRRADVQMFTESSVLIGDVHLELQSDWDPTEGSFVRSSIGDHDFSVSKVSEDGDFVWMLAVGGYLGEDVNAIAETYNTVFYCGTFGYNSECEYSLGTSE